jgi:hypothetical protein
MSEAKSGTFAFLPRVVSLIRAVYAKPTAGGDNFMKIIYPRSQNLADNARASIHEGRF